MSLPDAVATFRILIIDDNPDESSVYGWYLAKIKDFKTILEYATNGSDGLKKLAQGKFDLVILDYSMPVMNGLQVLEKMRQARDQTPVVMMTGGAGDRAAIESFKHGVLDYVLKEDLPRLDFPGLIRRALEMARLRRDKLELESLDALKNRFFERLAYYIRRPVVTGLGVLDMLVEERMGPLSSLQKESLGTLQREYQHLFDLAEDLNNLQWLFLKSESLVKRRVSLNALLQERLQASRRFWEEKGMTCESSIPEQPIEVEGDPERLAAAIDNILSNAVRFTPYGGRIGALLRRAGNNAELIIADTGKGLGAEDRERLFDNFRWLESAALPERLNGLGLGLSVCRRIAEIHGGALQVDSEGPDRGTVVTLRFPAIRQDAPLPSAAAK